MTPVPVLRLGILGCAEIAERAMIPAIAAVPGVAWTTIASRDRHRATTWAGRYAVTAVSDYDSLLARDDLDAVYVPVPTGLHAHWAIRALRAGKHVLVEKPLATTASEAEAVLAAARASGRVVMESLMFTHHGQHRAVADLLRSGAIGPLREVVAHFTIPPRPADDIRYRADLGGGALLDLGAYGLCAARMFLGPGLRVRRAALDQGEDGVDLGGAVALTDDSGHSGRVVFSLRGHYRCRYVLRGRHGRIVVDRAFTTPATLAPQVSLEDRTGARTVVLPAENHFVVAVAAFAAAVARGDGAPELHDSILARAATLDAVRAAARRSADMTDVNSDRGQLALVAGRGDS